MKFTLEIDCDNAAFAENGACNEIADILAELAERMEWGAEPLMTLRDANGNTVGFARFIGDDGDMTQPSAANV